MAKAKRILVSPLSWGLGHATRDLPIMRDFLSRGHRLTALASGRVLELAELGKTALFVPTPGQTEQEYLSDIYRRRGLFHSVGQYELDIRRDVELARKMPGVTWSIRPAPTLPAFTTRSSHNISSSAENEPGRLTQPPALQARARRAEVIVSAGIGRSAAFHTGNLKGGVFLRRTGVDNVQYLDASANKMVCDEPSVTPSPVCLGTHHCRPLVLGKCKECAKGVGEIRGEHIVGIVAEKGGFLGFVGRPPTRPFPALSF